VAARGFASLYHRSFTSIVVVLLIPAASVLATYLLLRALLRYFPIRVYELGIEGYDAFGRRTYFTWPQIQGVRPISMAGLKYLRVVSTGTKRTLWLPRFLIDQQAFSQLVAELAGENHPLTRSLSEAAA